MTMTSTAADKVKEIAKCFALHCNVPTPFGKLLDDWVVSKEGSRLVGELVEDGKNFSQLWDWSLKVLRALAELVRLKQLKENSKLGRPSSSEALLEHENKKEAAWAEAMKIVTDFSKAHRQLIEATEPPKIN